MEKLTRPHNPLLRTPEVDEVEARLFARLLLVPTKMLKSEVRQMKIEYLGKPEIKSLARKFRVEEHVMMMRLVEEKMVN